MWNPRARWKQMRKDEHRAEASRQPILSLVPTEVHNSFLRKKSQVHVRKGTPFTKKEDVGFSIRETMIRERNGIGV